MHTLRQYLMSLSDPCGLTRTLGEVEVCRDATGRICFSVGNSAVVFRIRHEGRIRSLRGYLQPQRHLREIYGERLLEKELYLYTSTHSGEWVDVVIGDWIEGEDLHTAIAAAAGTGDTERLRRLSEGFDRLAAAMVADDRAHGDLKPENILVTADGELRPIDFDAAYLPCFAGETSPELGTAAYQHPARTAEDFNARLDDYPAALIATALHALSLDPSLWERYGGVDTLLYDPRRIATDRALQESIDRFEAQGMAVEYRMARLLYAPRPELPELGALLAEAVRRADCRRREEASRRGEQPPGEAQSATAMAEAGPLEHCTAAQPANEGSAAREIPELFVEGGRWGYRTRDRVVIPPLYDNGFDFTEGLAAVLLGRTWHFIDTEGHTRLSCPGCEAVKPFHEGRARLFRNGRQSEIDHRGDEFEI